MAITMKTIDGGTITSLDDAVLQNVLSMRQNGVLEGMGASLAGTTVTVQPGRALIYGRLIDVDLTEIDIPLTATSETGIVYLQAEPNGETPASIGVLSAQGGVTPQQDDLINGGEIYQLVLATFAVNSTTVSDFEANVDIAINTPADFVVQNGKSGYWTFRKWNSGRCECWGRDPEVENIITIPPNTQVQEVTIALPAGLFKEIDYANVILSVTQPSVTNWSLNSLMLSQTNNFVFNVSNTGSSKRSIRPYMEIKGTWK